MRAIERKIIQCLRGWNGEGVKNISCRDSVEVDDKRKKYYLWGSLIFWNDSENIYHFSARGYGTSTTKSRLNQILLNFFNAGIYQKNFNWLLCWNGKEYPIDKENIFYFKGNKLYRKSTHDVEVLPL